MTRQVLTITLLEAENGYVLNVNALGAGKQFIATDFESAKKTLNDLCQAITEPPPPNQAIGPTGVPIAKSVRLNG